MTAHWLPLLPIIVMVITTIVALCTWHNLKQQCWTAIIGTAALLLSAIILMANTIKYGILVTHIGSWHAPYGITVVVDTLSAIMVLLTAIVGFCVALFSVADIKLKEVNSGFYPAFCILLIGLCGAFVTGDLFNLYVWFEVTVISSFVLMGCGNRKIQLDGAVKYVILNLIATLFLLTAIALIYGLTGALSLASIAERFPHIQNSGLVTSVCVFLLLSFAMKAALFPLFFWLPASYHTPTFSASAIFAGLLSKLGVYALFRVTTLLFVTNPIYLRHILLVGALLTLLIGIFGALSQKELRRILSFTLISHIGYMILGLAIYTPLAIIGGIFYLLQHVLIKVNLFFCSAVSKRLTGSTNIKHMGDLYKSHPFFAIGFFIPALALAGVPPLSGFWAKLSIIVAAFQAHAYVSAFIALLVSVLSLWVMIRIWLIAFCRKKQNEEQHAVRFTKTAQMFTFIPMGILLILTLVISLDPLPVFKLSKITAHQLLDSKQYIQAVLGDES